jgi:hypothetical protein
VQAQTESARIKGIFKVLNDTAEILPEWEKLVVKYHVSGKHAHDTRLVAAMIVHKVPKILTFNQSDFLRYPRLLPSPRTR